MVDLALMTVEITLIDQNKTIAIGGPPNQAIAVQSKLAEEMKFPSPGGDALLLLALERKDLTTLVMPILAGFSDLGWCFVDERHNPMGELFHSHKLTTLN